NDFKTTAAATNSITHISPADFDLTGLGVPQEIVDGGDDAILNWFIYNGALDDGELELFEAGVPLDVIFAGELE
ncbi:hypothetical protein IJ531_01465, partial [bacterium]|nr:hypothetical protein [bacterium]